MPAKETLARATSEWSQVENGPLLCSSETGLHSRARRERWPGGCGKLRLPRPRNNHVPSCRPIQNSVVMRLHAVVSAGFGRGAEPHQRAADKGAGRTANQDFWMQEQRHGITLHAVRIRRVLRQVMRVCLGYNSAPVRNRAHPSPPHHAARNLVILNASRFLSMK